MITTAPMLNGLGDMLALGLLSGPDCVGMGRKCKPPCKSAVRVPAVVRGGCGCSGLSGMGSDLIDYAIENTIDPYDPNAEMTGYYDKPVSTGGTIQIPQIWSDIPTNTTVSVQTQRAVYRVGGAGYQATPKDSGSMWPLLALAGAALVVMMAN